MHSLARKFGLVLRQINEFLSVSLDGNKSGALLLTIFELISQCGDEPFTKRRAASAVQHDNSSARLAGACLKHPAFNGTRASP